MGCCWSSPKRGFLPAKATRTSHCKLLVCIDFDGTMTEGNFLADALDKIPMARHFLPLNFQVKNSSNRLQGRKAGPCEQLLDEAIKAMQLVEGMDQMIVSLHGMGAELIIVSDNFDLIVDI